MKQQFQTSCSTKDFNKIVAYLKSKGLKNRSKFLIDCAIEKIQDENLGDAKSAFLGDMKSAIQEEHRKLSVSFADVVSHISHSRTLEKKIEDIFNLISNFQVEEINSLHCKFDQFMKALIFKGMTESNFESYIKDTKIQQQSRLSTLKLQISELLMEG